MNKKAKVLEMTEPNGFVSAIMEYLFRFDEILDGKLLTEAIEKNEGKKPLKKIAKELGFD